MLSFIGFIAICYVCIKFFPEILVFSIKALIFLILLGLLLMTAAWVFGIAVSFQFNEMLFKLQTINMVGV